MVLRAVRREDLRALQVLGQGGPKVSILEQAQVLRLGRIGGADLARLDRKVGLAKTTARKKLFIYRTGQNR